LTRCAKCRYFAYGTYTGNPSCTLLGVFSSLRPNGSGFVDGRRKMCDLGEESKIQGSRVEKEG